MSAAEPAEPTSGVAQAPARDGDQLRRAMVASSIGGAIEWYDFFLYSTVAGLVFAKLYFPNSDRLTGTLQAFGVYAVGFVARPVGAMIFGHYGDRVGRKATLVATLMLMGIATVAVAFVPSYARIGPWGGAILILLRIVQGIGVGGEWGGGVLIASEWARKENRGFVTSWPQFGAPCGLLLANLAVLGSSAISGDQFLSWGWRIPFVSSLVLIAVGLYIRLGVAETPSFTDLEARQAILKAPAWSALRRHWRPILYTVLLRFGEITPFYIFTAFVFSYGVDQLHLPRDLLLAGVMGAAVVSGFNIPLAGWLSDRIGRLRVFLIGAVATMVMVFVCFHLMETRTPLLVFLALAISLIPHDFMWGPMAAFVSEKFPANVRYSGASIGTSLATIFAGGPSPMIAAALLAASGSSTWVGLYVALGAIVSIVGAFALDRYAAAPEGEPAP